jgi:hypothetical protein
LTQETRQKCQETSENRHFYGYSDVNESRESPELLHFFDGPKKRKAAGFPTAFRRAL